MLELMYSVEQQQNSNASLAVSSGSKLSCLGLPQLLFLQLVRSTHCNKVLHLAVQVDVNIRRPTAIVYPEKCLLTKFVWDLGSDPKPYR